MYQKKLQNKKIDQVKYKKITDNYIQRNEPKIETTRVFLFYSFLILMNFGYVKTMFLFKNNSSISKEIYKLKLLQKIS